MIKKSIVYQKNISVFGHFDYEVHRLVFSRTNTAVTYSSLIRPANKLQPLPLVNFFSLVYYLRVGPGDKLLGMFINYGQKRFITSGQGINAIILFTVVSYTFCDKLECSSLASLSRIL